MWCEGSSSRVRQNGGYKHKHLSRACTLRCENQLLQLAAALRKREESWPDAWYIGLVERFILGLRRRTAQVNFCRAGCRSGSDGMTMHSGPDASPFICLRR
jgi:hypothetical protein